MENKECIKQYNVYGTNEKSRDHGKIVQEFKDVILCDCFSKKLSVSVTASLREGKLTITGYDTGDIVEECCRILTMNTGIGWIKKALTDCLK